MNLYLIASLLGVSFACNLILLLLVLKKSKRTYQQTYDVQALLRDMASGPALLKIEYLDRADVLLRSPRHFT